jgi:hypothetical protein
MLFGSYESNDDKLWDQRKGYVVGAQYGNVFDKSIKIIGMKDI